MSSTSAPQDAPPGPGGDRARPPGGAAVPAALYAGMAMLLLVLQHLSGRALREPGYSFRRWEGLRTFLSTWSQFDGPEYILIADEGYWYVAGERTPVVWFPLYPNLMRAVERVTQDFLVAGVVVSLAAGLAAAVLYWRWLTLQGMGGATRLVAFGVLALYPYGWYLYGVVHSDSLFLALVIAAFTLVQRDRLVAAGLVGALATATRPTGMALLPALVLYGLQRDGVLSVPDAARGLVARFAVPCQVQLSRLRARSLAPALSVLGVGAYGAFLWARFGSPLLFITNQQVYHPGGRPILKLAFLVRWRDFGEDPTYTLTITGQALVALLVVASAPAVARRFGFAYGAFLVVLVAIPTISTEDFMGTGRYLMAAFPAWALLGERLAEHRRARVVVLAVMGLVMIGLAMAFARSVYIT